MKTLLSRYPDFYEDSPEFNALLDVLQIEILKLWVSYYLFFEYVVLYGENPTVTCKTDSDEANT